MLTFPTALTNPTGRSGPPAIAPADNPPVAITAAPPPSLPAVLRYAAPLALTGCADPGTLALQGSLYALPPALFAFTHWVQGRLIRRNFDRAIPGEENLAQRFPDVREAYLKDMRWMHWGATAMANLNNILATAFVFSTLAEGVPINPEDIPAMLAVIAGGTLLFPYFPGSLFVLWTASRDGRALAAAAQKDFKQTLDFQCRQERVALLKKHRKAIKKCAAGKISVADLFRTFKSEGSMRIVDGTRVENAVSPVFFMPLDFDVVSIGSTTRANDAELAALLEEREFETHAAILQKLPDARKKEYVRQFAEKILGAGSREHQRKIFSEAAYRKLAARLVLRLAAAAGDEKFVAETRTALTANLFLSVAPEGYRPIEAPGSEADKDMEFLCLFVREVCCDTRLLDKKSRFERFGNIFYSGPGGMPPFKKPPKEYLDAFLAAVVKGRHHAWNEDPAFIWLTNMLLILPPEVRADFLEFIKPIVVSADERTGTPTPGMNFAEHAARKFDAFVAALRGEKAPGSATPATDANAATAVRTEPVLPSATAAKPTLLLKSGQILTLDAVNAANALAERIRVLYAGGDATLDMGNSWEREFVMQDIETLSAALLKTVSSELNATGVVFASQEYQSRPNEYKERTLHSALSRVIAGGSAEHLRELLAEISAAHSADFWQDHGYSLVRLFTGLIADPERESPDSPRQEKIRAAVADFLFDLLPALSDAQKQNVLLKLVAHGVRREDPVFIARIFAELALPREFWILRGEPVAAALIDAWTQERTQAEPDRSLLTALKGAVAEVLPRLSEKAKERLRDDQLDLAALAAAPAKTSAAPKKSHADELAELQRQARLAEAGKALARK